MITSAFWIVHDVADRSEAMSDPAIQLAQRLPGLVLAGRLDPAGDPGAALDALAEENGGGRGLVLCQTLAQALARAQADGHAPAAAVQAWMDRATALVAACGPRADRVALLPADALTRDPRAAAEALAVWFGRHPAPVTAAPPDPLMQVIARACLHDMPALAAAHDSLSAASLVPHAGPVDLTVALGSLDRLAQVQRRADLLESEAYMTREELSRIHRNQRLTEHRMRTAQTQMNRHLENVKARLTAQMTAQVAATEARGQAEIARIFGSLSWRVTRPLRAARRLLGRVRRRLRGRAERRDTR